MTPRNAYLTRDGLETGFIIVMFILLAVIAVCLVLVAVVALFVFYGAVAGAAVGGYQLLFTLITGLAR